MRHWALTAMTLAVAACSLNPGTGTKVRPTSASKKPLTVAASATPAASTHRGIVDAIRGTLAACEVGRGQNTIELISDNGLGLISDNGLGVISNNGGGIVSNNGSGLISDNGLGLISNNGGGYHVLASSPLPSDSPYFVERVAPILGLMWHGRVFKPDFHGDITGYNVDDYEAKGEAATPIEHYAWDQPKVKFDPLSLLSPPMIVKMDYALRPDYSSQFSSIKAIAVHLTLAVADLKMKDKPIYKDFGCDYTLSLSFPNAPDEEIMMTATEFVYKENFGLGRADFSPPKSFKAHGESALGTLEMGVQKEYGEGEERQPATVTATRTGKDGRKATLEYEFFADRRQRSVVTDVSSGVEAVIELDAKRKGTGVVRTHSDQKTLGTITWDTKGLGTIVFTDGSTEQVRVF